MDFVENPPTGFNEIFVQEKTLSTNLAEQFILKFPKFYPIKLDFFFHVCSKHILVIIKWKHFVSLLYMRLHP